MQLLCNGVARRKIVPNPPYPPLHKGGFKGS